MIEVKNLNLNLNNQQILSDISFTLENGNNLIILGRSGSGKTVLIKTLLGFFEPDSGTILVDGLPVSSSQSKSNPVATHSFAMVFQNSALLDSFSVYQNVALPLYEGGIINTETIESLVRKSLSIVGLEHTSEMYPAELSGGMRKRIGIARALVYNPRYIVFDEPVSGLDPITAAEVLFYINQIVSSDTTTTITVTHDTHNLEKVGNQVLFLEEGRQLFFGSLAEMGECLDSRIRKFTSS